MSPQELVRQRIEFRERSRRSLEERLAARFPALARRLAARVQRLPPASPFRQKMLARSIAGGFAAMKRGDVELVLATFYDPDVVWHGTVGGLDDGRVVRGHEQVARGFAENAEAWERLDLRPVEIIDTGEQLIVFVHEVARGRGSGVLLETDTAVINDLRDGRVVRVRPYMDPAQALAEAGLEDQRLPSPPG